MNELQSNWYKEQFSGSLELRNSLPIENFDTFLKMNEEHPYLQSFDDIGKFKWETVRLWMHYKGVYLLPTIEFIDWLYENIFPEDKYDDDYMDNKVIEIGAGFGLLGDSLGIRMTDSKLQERNPDVMAYYTLMGQPLIKYPKNVIMMDANTAVNYYKARTVIGSYITFGSKSAEVCSTLGANYYGPDMEKLYQDSERIVLIGNLSINAHMNNPILKYPHKEYSDVPGLLTRSDPNLNRVWVWEKE